MGTTTSIVMVFAVMVIATQVSRLGPLLFTRMKIPASFEEWLGHVPIGILTAMIIPELFSASKSGGQQLNYLFVLISLLCLMIGLKFKNLLLTTLMGVACVALGRFFGL